MPDDGPAGSGVAAAVQVAAAVAGAKHARGRGGAGAEPDVPGALVEHRHGEVRAARRERAFVRKRGWQSRGGRRRPGVAAVGGQQEDEASVDRIADRDAVPRVPEDHRVEERLLVAIDELRRPRLSAIAGLEDARRFARADAEHVGRLVVDRRRCRGSRASACPEAARSSARSCRHRSCGRSCRCCRWPRPRCRSPR